MKDLCRNFKLGKIKNNKLVGFDKQMLWNFDVTMAIFIRDGLKAYKDINTSIPYCIYNKYDKANLSEKEKDKLASDEWNKILDDIIKGFQFYVDDNIKDDITKLSAFKKSMRLLSTWFNDIWD